VSAAIPQPRQSEHYRRVTADILDAQRPIRILRAIAWPDSVAEEFFQKGGRELPRPVYRRRDFSDTIAEFQRIRASVGGESEIDRFLRATCDSWIAGARLLEAVGTREFYPRSVECYGRPSSISCDGRTTNLMLAEHFDRVLKTYAGADLGAPPSACMPAERVAETMEARLREYFLDDPIRCEVAETLSANAVTSAEVVKLKRGAVFTAREVEQLLVHEGYVHLGTTLNGRRQPYFTLLGQGAPRTTCGQEGLAIFAEFISHTIDLDRLRRLADRILAIKMSEEGADFLELYRFFLTRGHAATAAFDCARRVVRGGLVEGGGPFTKDVVYLDGLQRVSNFLRAALSRGRADFVRMLFCGKVALEDVPLLVALERQGWIEGPRYLPSWARDLRFLTAYMSFSAFLQETDLDATAAYYEALTPREGSDITAADCGGHRSH
jgi:uncharacterized protein (TIGR02421 family)